MTETEKKVFPIQFQTTPYPPEPEVPDKEEKKPTSDSFFCINSCDGHCCRDYAVLITVQDARRILDAIPTLDVRRFIYFYLGEIEPSTEYAKIRIGDNEYCLGMFFTSEAEACVFQTKLGLCGIHEFSPMICKAFPFTLDEKDEIIYKPGIICKVFLPIGDRKKLKAFLKQRQKELKEYRKLVEDWNKNHPYGDMLEFLRFAKLCE